MKTILVVDSHPKVRAMLVSNIQSNNLIAVEATNGTEAVEIIKTTPANLVVTEIMLPQMNGFELSRWLNSNSETWDIPIIIYTHLDDEFSCYWSFKSSNVRAFISKTEPISNLLQAIQGYIN